MSLNEEVLKEQLNIIVAAVNNGQFSQGLTACNTYLKNKQDLRVQLFKAWFLHKLDCHDEALELFERGLQANIKDKNSLSLMQQYLIDESRYDEACKLCHDSLRLFPSDNEILRRLGSAYYHLGENRLSIEAFRESLKVANVANTNIGLAMVLLREGHYQEAFPLYEQRSEVYAKLLWVNNIDLPMPHWQGEDLKGKTILLWTEQGLGDTIQFCRLVILLVQQGAIVDFLVHQSHQTLMELLTTVEGIRQIHTIKNGKLTLSNQYDYHCPTMSLPYYLSLNPYHNSVPTPYIVSLTSHHSKWQKIKAMPGLKVGLVWKTHIESDADDDYKRWSRSKNDKCVPFEQFKKLLDIKNCSFVSLQYPVSNHDRKHLDAYRVYNPENDINSFTDTADLIENLDIVVSIDTAVVHLAGAMAKPVLNLLPYAADWRWQKNRDDSPWYRTMKLYRQPRFGDWESVMFRLVNSIKDFSEYYAKYGTVDLTVSHNDIVKP